MNFFHLLCFSSQFMIVLKNISNYLLAKKMRENVFRVCTSFYFDNIVIVRMVEKTNFNLREPFLCITINNNNNNNNNNFMFLLDLLSKDVFIMFETNWTSIFIFTPVGWVVFKKRNIERQHDTHKMLRIHLSQSQCFHKFRAIKLIISNYFNLVSNIYFK